MRVDIKDLKEQLSDEDVIAVMRSLKSSPPVVENANEMVFQTVCHNSPSDCNSTKLYYYKNTNLFKCYTGCEGTFDIFETVIKARGLQTGLEISLQESVDYVMAVTGMNFGYSTGASKEADDWSFLDEYLDGKKERPLITIAEEYDPIVLEVFQNWYYRGWKDEGITTEAMKEFNIKFWSKEDQIIIPHYDINNKLIGIRARNLDPTAVAKGYKYMPVLVENIRYRHNTSLNLYGLNFVKDKVSEVKKVILFEGEKSSILSKSIYGEDSIAASVSGFNIFKVQRDLLLKLGVTEVTIAFDKQYRNEEERERHMLHLKDVAGVLNPYMTTYAIVDTEDLLDYKDSPIDKGREVFEKLLDGRILMKE